jgi:hypothetical protein
MRAAGMRKQLAQGSPSFGGIIFDLGQQPGKRQAVTIQDTSCEGHDQVMVRLRW